MFKLRKARQNSAGNVSNGSVASSLRSTGSDASCSCAPKGCLKSDKEGAKRQGSASTRSGSENSSRPSGTPPKRVKFTRIHVREFERVIGDNPSCSSGAPIGIGWRYAKDKSLSMEEYEQARPRRRAQLDLVLTRQEREQLLLEWGASFQQIIDAIRVNVKVKNQRRRTVNAIGTYDRWEEVVEKGVRKIKKTLLLQRPMRRDYDDSFTESQKAIAKSIEELPALVDESGDEESTNELRNSWVPPTAMPTIAEPEPMDKYAALEYMKRMKQYHEERMGMEQRYNGDSQRPASLIEVDAASQGHSMLSVESDYQNVSNSSELDYEPSERSGDGFEFLTRDDSFWEVAGSEGPGIRRKIMPIIICEDTIYDDFQPVEHGFMVQPPPYSNNMVSKWE